MGLQMSFVAALWFLVIFVFQYPPPSGFDSRWDQALVRWVINEMLCGALARSATLRFHYAFTPDHQSWSQ